MDFQSPDRPTSNEPLNAVSHGTAQSAASFVTDAGSMPTSAMATLAAAPVRKEHPPKLYRIGEVVDYSGMSRQTIHNYTVMGLLRESGWSRGGHRLYDESVFERLDVINALRSQHKPLNVIKEELERFPDSNSPPQGRPPG